jgi:F0F1-type ATP synthase membrane subunit c/vacuolar-type H+-ATPase subunit K
VIQTNMILAIAFAEAIGIYGLVVAIILAMAA